MTDKFEYTKARAIAEGLINKFGEAGSFIVKGLDGGVDEWGDPTAGTPDQVFNGTVTPLLSYKQGEVDGEQILKTDSYVFFHCDEVPPIDSKITINGKEFRAVDIVRLDSVAGVNVYVKVQLRR